MSFSGVAGGFQGGDALLAFAAIQQGRMNEEMTESMRVADLRSQMSGDLADIKAHLDMADKHPEKFGEVDAEMQAFLTKYGDEPALEDVTSTVGDIAGKLHARLGEISQQNTQMQQGYDIGLSEWQNGGQFGVKPTPPTLVTFDPADGTVKSWTDQITEKLDSSGTNDQLAMIHIKQLNDNINNSSSMVSGIIESRNNATSSIINNIA